jgi:hypothetical protein
MSHIYAFSFKHLLVPWKFHPKLKVKGPKVGPQWTLLGSSAVINLSDGRYGLTVNIEHAFGFSVLAVFVGVVTSLTLRRQRRRDSYTVVGPAVVR